MPPPLDTQARKQLLLTRIALERAEWVRDVDGLRRHLTPSELLGSLLHRAGGGGWATALFGHRTEDGAASPGWAGRVMAIVLMLRRHPLWWPLLAGVWPWLRARRAARRPSSSFGGLAVAVVGLAGAAAGWWWVRGRHHGEPGGGRRR